MSQHTKIVIPTLDIIIDSPQEQQLKEFTAYSVKMINALRALQLDYLFKADFVAPTEPTFAMPTRENLDAARAANNLDLFNRHKAKISRWTEYLTYVKDSSVARSHIVTSLSTDMVALFIKDINDDSKSGADILASMTNYFQPSSDLQASSLRAKLENLTIQKGEMVKTFAARLQQLAVTIQSCGGKLVDDKDLKNIFLKALHKVKAYKFATQMIQLQKDFASTSFRDTVTSLSTMLMQTEETSAEEQTETPNSKLLKMGNRGDHGRGGRGGIGGRGGGNRGDGNHGGQGGRVSYTSTLVCFLCDEHGHVVQDCPLKIKLKEFLSNYKEEADEEAVGTKRKLTVPKTDPTIRWNSKK